MYNCYLLNKSINLEYESETLDERQETCGEYNILTNTTGELYLNSLVVLVKIFGFERNSCKGSMWVADLRRI